MLTALQFSQLLTAAWSGPAAAHFATISHYVAAEGDYSRSQYCASYHVGKGCYLGEGPCPFQAITAAVAAFAAAQPVPGAAVVARAAQVVRRAAAQLAGPAPRFQAFAGRARRHRCARLRYV